jgi:hypothetical protein
VDPKQLAAFKAIQKSIEVAMGEGQWDGGVAAYFDVTPVDMVAYTLTNISFSVRGFLAGRASRKRAKVGVNIGSI